MFFSLLSFYKQLLVNQICHQNLLLKIIVIVAIIAIIVIIVIIIIATVKIIVMIKAHIQPNH